MGSPLPVENESAEPTDVEPTSRRLITNSSSGGNVRIALSILFFGDLLCLSVIAFMGVRRHPINYWSNAYFLIPLVGGLPGLVRSLRIKKGRIARDCRVPQLFCLGLVAWGIGCAIWLYYNVVLGVEAPYPSIADFGYMGCLICWFVGLVIFCIIADVNLIEDFRAPATILVFFGGLSTWVMVWAHNGQLSQYSPTSEFLKFLLDVSYPLVDSVNLALLGVLFLGRTRNRFNCRMRRTLIIVIVGYSFLYMADLSFNVCTSLPKTSPLSYYNGGLTDWLFSISLFLLSIGVSFIPIAKEPDSCLFSPTAS